MMGDPKSPKENNLLLPPGSRFFPTDQQLISFYLTNKNTQTRITPHSQQEDVIKEIDLYQFDPFGLPDRVSFRFGRGGRKRHYYCYVPIARVLKEGNTRSGGSGVWRRCGRVRDVVVAGVGKAVVGVRKKFVFFLGNERTDWVLYEYSLRNKDLASFVLCRVFVKSHKSKGSENPLSSCGEGSVATVRHIGIQHDGINKLANGEDKMLDNKFLDHNNKVLAFTLGLNSQPHDGVTSEPIGVKMRSSGPSNGREMIVDSLTAQELAHILEEDFIELDDLVSPFTGID